MRSSDPGIHAPYMAERPGSAGLWTGSGMALQNLLIAYILNHREGAAGAVFVVPVRDAKQYFPGAWPGGCAPVP
ncbi:MAG: hypothetical protein ACYCT0_11955 [Sulfobacillus sp.]